jgi:hypothetical protein
MTKTSAPMNTTALNGRSQRRCMKYRTTSEPFAVAMAMASHRLNTPRSTHVAATVMRVITISTAHTVSSRRTGTM